MMEASAPEAAARASSVWIPEIVKRLAAFLSGNDHAALRLLDKRTAALLPRETHIRLSQPVAPDIFAAKWSADGACRDLPLRRRHQLMALTAATDVVANLAVAVQASGCAGAPHATLEVAVAAGALRSCQWLVAEPGCIPKGVSWAVVLNTAAKTGRWEVCAWALEAGAGSGLTLSPSAAAAAASEGHVELMERILQDLLSRPAKLSRKGNVLGPLVSADGWAKMGSGVAAGCDLASLERFWTRPEVQALVAPKVITGRQLMHWECMDQGHWEAQKNTLLAHAAGSPTPDWEAKVEFLMAKGLRLTEDAFPCALERLRGEQAVQRMEWLLPRGREELPRAVPDGYAAMHASSAYDAVALLYMENEDARTPYFSDHNVREYVDADICRAAGEGNLGFLQALHAGGFRFDVMKPTAWALGGGCMPVVRWMRSTFRQRLLLGEDWDLGWHAPAPAHNHAQAQVQAQAQAQVQAPGDPGQGAEPGGGPAGGAAQGEGDDAPGEAGAAPYAGADAAAILEWLNSSPECDVDAVWDQAAAAGNSPLLRFMCGAGLRRPRSGSPYAKAAGNDDLQTLATLRELGLPWGKRKDGFVSEVIRSWASLPTLQWMHARGCFMPWEEMEASVRYSYVYNPVPSNLMAWIQRMKGEEGARGAGDGSGSEGAGPKGAGGKKRKRKNGRKGAGGGEAIGGSSGGAGGGGAGAGGAQAGPA